MSGPMTARAKRPWSRVLPWSLLAISLAIAHLAHARLGPLDAHAAAHLPVLCPLKRLAGIPCPTCGLGRSLLATWSGDLSRGWSHHPLGPGLLVVAVVLCTALIWRPRLLISIRRALAARMSAHPKTLAAVVIAYTLWGFVR